MNVLIVDDEPLARQRLCRMIEGFPGCVVAGEAEDGRMALNLVAEQPPDVVLLDVNMPGIDGLEVARELAAVELPPAVIFVTAYGEYALPAHAGQSDGYLLKPVYRDDLANALARARRPSRAQRSALLEHAGECAPPGYICARTREGVERVPVRDVLYFWADRKYTSAFHLHGELLINQSLSELEQALSEHFVRVHRKALVARARIAGIKYNGDGNACVTLRDAPAEVPVSRRRLADVRKLLAC